MQVRISPAIATSSHAYVELAEDPEVAAMADVANGIATIDFDHRNASGTSAAEKPLEPRKDRSKIPELAKKMGGGKKGLWGKPEDMLTIPPIDRDDPNYDSQQETDDIVLVTSAGTGQSPSPSPRTRSLTKARLFEENPIAFGESPVPAQVKKAMEEIITEYFSSGEIDEVQRRLKEVADETGTPTIAVFIIVTCHDSPLWLRSKMLIMHDLVFML
jgi:hypothetical protein